MPYKNPEKDRNYKHEWENERKRGKPALKAKLARQKPRREYDKEGINRKGKDIDHVRSLSMGGSADMSNTRLRSPSQNRSFDRNADHSMKKNAPPKKKK